MFGWVKRLKRHADHSADAWVVQCTKCGYAAPARQRGIYRAYASSGTKRILARCTACNSMTMARLTKDRDLADGLREIESG